MVLQRTLRKKADSRDGADSEQAVPRVYKQSVQSNSVTVTVSRFKFVNV